MKNIKFVALIVALVLALPGAALAQDSSVDAYNDGNNSGILGQIEGSGGGDDPATQASSDPESQQAQAGDESLPFTGADLGIVGAAGASLLLLGFGLRRMTQGPARA